MKSQPPDISNHHKYVELTRKLNELNTSYDEYKKRLPTKAEYDDLRRKEEALRRELGIEEELPVISITTQDALLEELQKAVSESEELNESKKILEDENKKIDAEKTAIEYSRGENQGKLQNLQEKINNSLKGLVKQLDSTGNEAETKLSKLQGEIELEEFPKKTNQTELSKLQKAISKFLMAVNALEKSKITDDVNLIISQISNLFYDKPDKQIASINKMQEVINEMQKNYVTRDSNLEEALYLTYELEVEQLIGENTNYTNLPKDGLESVKEKLNEQLKRLEKSTEITKESSSLKEFIANLRDTLVSIIKKKQQLEESERFINKQAEEIKNLQTQITAKEKEIETLETEITAKKEEIKEIQQKVQQDYQDLLDKWKKNSKQYEGLIPEKVKEYIAAVQEEEEAQQKKIAEEATDKQLKEIIDLISDMLYLKYGISIKGYGKDEYQSEKKILLEYFLEDGFKALAGLVEDKEIENLANLGRITLKDSLYNLCKDLFGINSLPTDVENYLGVLQECAKALPKEFVRGQKIETYRDFLAWQNLSLKPFLKNLNTNNSPPKAAEKTDGVETFFKELEEKIEQLDALDLSFLPKPDKEAVVNDLQKFKGNLAQPASQFLQQSLNARTKVNDRHVDNVSNRIIDDIGLVMARYPGEIETFINYLTDPTNLFNKTHTNPELKKQAYACLQKLYLLPDSIKEEFKEALVQISKNDDLSKKINQFKEVRSNYESHRERKTKGITAKLDKFLVRLELLIKKFIKERSMKNSFITKLNEERSCSKKGPSIG
jgi:hypothetical protein